MDNLWLPEGNHLGLHITHLSPRENAGAFVPSGWRAIHHTGELPMGPGRVRQLAQIVTDKRAAPHFCMDPSRGEVLQLLPLNVAARTLMHPPGVPETNRAHAIQVEYCGVAAHSHRWSDTNLRNIAAMWWMVEHRVPIPRDTRTFPGTRIPTANWLGASGHFGHCHVPGNDHVDPGKFNIERVFHHMASFDSHH